MGAFKGKGKTFIKIWGTVALYRQQCFFICLFVFSSPRRFGKKGVNVHVGQQRVVTAVHIWQNWCSNLLFQMRPQSLFWSNLPLCVIIKGGSGQFLLQRLLGPLANSLPGKPESKHWMWSQSLSLGTLNLGANHSIIQVMTGSDFIGATAQCLRDSLFLSYDSSASPAVQSSRDPLVLPTCFPSPVLLPPINPGRLCILPINP